MPTDIMTRGHNKKLIELVCHTNLWELGNSTSFQIVRNYWNSVTPNTVNAKTSNSFFGKLHSHELTRSTWVVEPSLGHCCKLIYNKLFIYLN